MTGCIDAGSIHFMERVRGNVFQSLLLDSSLPQAQLDGSSRIRDRGEWDEPLAGRTSFQAPAALHGGGASALPGGQKDATSTVRLN